jgi:hypothetical protein
MSRRIGGLNINPRGNHRQESINGHATEQRHPIPKCRSVEVWYSASSQPTDMCGLELPSNIQTGTGLSITNWNYTGRT